MPVELHGTGSSLPRALSALLNDLLERLTNVDFRKRPIDLEWVRSRLWIAIRIAENQTECDRRLTLAREIRRRRAEKAQMKADRLARYLARSKPNA